MNLLHKMAGVACCAMGILSQANAAPDPNFHIYIAYGQSNMAGAAKDFTDFDKKEHPRYKMFATTACSNLGRPTVGEIYPAKPPMFHCGEGLSVADWFGRNMADSLPDVTIGVIPVAVGGTSIQLFEPANYKSYLAGAPDWLVNWAMDYGSDGNAMGRIIEIAKKAQEVGVIKGFIFHQGETDGGMGDWEKRVAATYEYMLKELGLKAEETPFVAGEMVAGGSCDGMRVRVRALSNYIANFGVAKSDNLPGASDRLHFTVEGYRGMGQRYAQEMLKLVNVEPVEPVPQEPFGGKPWAIPGKIQMEDFDVPGVGSGNDSYKDNDSENHGDSDYRKDTGVDLYKKSNGRIVVGYNQVGEWLEYTVNVAETGSYKMFAAVASAYSTSSFKLSMDGKDITEEIAVPAAKSGEENYDEYNKVDAVVNLTAGKHILRFTVTGDWMDIDYINFVAGADGKDTDPIGGGESVEKPDTSATAAILKGVQLLKEAETVFTIFDMQGRQCLTVTARHMTEAMNKVQNGKFQDLKQGIYLVRGKNGFGKMSQKVMAYEK